MEPAREQIVVPSSSGQLGLLYGIRIVASEFMPKTVRCEECKGSGIQELSGGVLQTCINCRATGRRELLGFMLGEDFWTRPEQVVKLLGE